MGLLTDEYPPFALANAGYPVRLSAAPGRLNRLAVLFRLILAIPAWLLLALIGYGVGAIGIVIWLIVLVTGTMPGALHQAVAAVVRYSARFYGYFFLMSGTYPGGLFGDPAEPDLAPAAAGLLAAPVNTGPGQPGHAPPGAAPPGAGQPGDGQRADAQPADGRPGDWQPGYGQVPSAAGWPTDPRAWRLELSTGAKRLVGLFIALGAVVLAAYIIVTVNLVSRSADNATRVDAINSISAAHSNLIGQLNALSQQVSACQSQPGTLGCVTKLDQQAAADIGAFAGAVRLTPVPSSAAPAEARLAAATDQVRSAFRQLGAATSVAQYEQIDSSEVGPRVAQFNSAYQNLGRALAGPADLPAWARDPAVRLAGPALGPLDRPAPPGVGGLVAHPRLEPAVQPPGGGELVGRRPHAGAEPGQERRAQGGRLADLRPLDRHAGAGRPASA